jgi:hypothetical protein
MASMATVIHHHFYLLALQVAMTREWGADCKVDSAAVLVQTSSSN